MYGLIGAGVGAVFFTVLYFLWGKEWMLELDTQMKRSQFFSELEDGKYVKGKFSSTGQTVWFVLDGKFLKVGYCLSGGIFVSYQIYLPDLKTEKKTITSIFKLLYSHTFTNRHENKWAMFSAIGF